MKTKIIKKIGVPNFAWSYYLFSFLDQKNGFICYNMFTLSLSLRECAGDGSLCLFRCRYALRLPHRSAYFAKRLYFQVCTRMRWVQKLSQQLKLNECAVNSSELKTGKNHIFSIFCKNRQIVYLFCNYSKLVRRMHAHFQWIHFLKCSSLKWTDSKVFFHVFVLAHSEKREIAYS